MAFCSNCGAKNDDGARFCTGCGTAVGGAPFIAPQAAPTPPQYQYQQTAETSAAAVSAAPEKIRHGFTTFVLWLGIIGSVIIGMLPILFEGDFGGGIYYLVDAVPYIALLKWKKWGFGTFICLGIWPIIWPPVANIQTAYELGMPPALLGILGLAIGTAIVFGVLKLKSRNGKSAWDQLEGGLLYGQ
jgi:hypothetical protein